MPTYVETGGSVPLRQPYAISGVSGFIFGLEGDRQKITRTCQRALATHGSYTFEAPTGLVLFCFLKMQRLQSESAPDDAKGAIRESELNVAIPLLMRAPGELLPRLVFYMPYLWVDSGAALIAGREIYGFPKQLATIRMPAALDEPAEFSVEGEVFTHFERGKMATRGTIARVHRLDARPAAGHGSIRDRLEELVEDARASAFGVSLPPPLDRLLPRPLDPLLSLVFLKQFRAISGDGSQACYRSVAQAAFEITELRRAQRLAGDYEIEIPRHDSVPLADELGFPAADATGLLRQRARFAWFADYDFRLQAGRELWVAP